MIVLMMRNAVGERNKNATELRPATRIIVL
jgi:hypothetical protein